MSVPVNCNFATGCKLLNMALPNMDEDTRNNIRKILEGIKGTRDFDQSRLRS